MILQATGLAEARTRLFSPPTKVADSEPSGSSVGRTAVVTPAELRGKLADLVSSFDPGAQTAMPQRPILSDEMEDITGSNLPETDAEISGFRSSGRNIAAPPRTRADAATVVRNPRSSAFGPEVSDTEAADDHTIPGLPRNVSNPAVLRPSSNSNSGGNATTPSNKTRPTRVINRRAVTCRPARGPKQNGGGAPAAVVVLLFASASSRER
jgi:hypothetical protein